MAERNINARAELQRLPLQTREDEVPHPSQCLGNAYSQDMRNLVLFIANNLNEDNPHIGGMLALLRHSHVYPSSISERR